MINARPRQTGLAHLAQNIRIARDQRRLGDDGERVPILLQHLQYLACQARFTIDRLVGVCVATDVDRLAAIARRIQLLAQQGGRIGLEEQFALEIDAGRQAHIGVRGSRVTIGAAVLAPAIRVDRAVELDVGTGVARDDGPRIFDRQRGAQGCAVRILLRPSIVHRLDSQGLKPA